MEVIALIGPSGTGKSHSALMVAHDYQADLIIDDGLVIKGSRILAGLSAKRQPTKIAAIKTALFSQEEHAQEAKQALSGEQPERLLVLGTSAEMVTQITQRLELPRPVRFIPIEEVATPKDIQKAKSIRQSQGKHVIPAPTVEVKPRFSGTLIEPLPTFFRRRSSSRSKYRDLLVDQSVVRPTFNYLGKFYIANNVLVQLATHAAQGVEGVAKVLKIQTKTDEHGLCLIVEMALDYGCSFQTVVRQAQAKIRETVEYATALNVLAVDVEIKKIVHYHQQNQEPGAG